MEARFPYTLVALLRPGVSQEDRTYLLNLITEAVKDCGGGVYRQEHDERELCYQGKGYTNATALIVCWEAPPSCVEKIRAKLRYETKILRYEILREEEKSDASRLREGPIKSRYSFFCTNPGLNQYLSENGRILPRKFTGLRAKSQRIMSRAVKTARKLGLLKL